jgi:signal peptidase I
MADPSHADDDALRRDLLEETLQECERLLAATEAEALEIRQTAKRHAQERADATARALTAAAERLREEAAADRAAAQEDRARAQHLHLEIEQRSSAVDDERRALAERTLEADRLREEAAADRAAAQEDRARAQQLHLEIEQRSRAVDDERQALADRNLEAEQRLARLQGEIERLTRLAQARLSDATALQAELEAERDAHRVAALQTAHGPDVEHLERLESEIAARLAEADQIAAERLAAADRHVSKRLERLDAELAARHADAERAAAEALAQADAARRQAAELLEDARRQASEQLAEASAAAGAQLADAQRHADALQRSTADAGAIAGSGTAGNADDEAARKVTAAERAAAERIAEADDEATRRLLDAMEEARRIVAGAEADATRIRSYAEQRVQPATDEQPDDRLDLTVADARPGSSDEEPKQRSRRRRGARALWIVLALGAVTATVRAYVVAPYTVNAASMEPQLSDGDRVVLNRLAFEVDAPERGDVVVFDTADVPGAAEAPSRRLVKRVVGLPGEKVQALDGALVVDDEVIDDPWQAAPTPAFGPILVPEGMVFVLGDNRSLSVDSRTFGVVPIGALTGRVEAVIWPLGDAGPL